MIGGVTAVEERRSTTPMGQFAEDIAFRYIAGVGGPEFESRSCPRYMSKNCELRGL